MTPANNTNKPRNAGRNWRPLAWVIITASCLGIVLGALLHAANPTHGENSLLWSLAGLTLGTGLLAAGANPVPERVRTAR